MVQDIFGLRCVAWLLSPAAALLLRRLGSRAFEAAAINHENLPFRKTKVTVNRARLERVLRTALLTLCASVRRRRPKRESMKLSKTTTNQHSNHSVSVYDYSAKTIQSLTQTNVHITAKSTRKKQLNGHNIYQPW